MGMRFHACRGSMSVGWKQGGLPPDSIIENDKAILEDTQRVIEKYHDTTRGSISQVFGKLNRYIVIQIDV